MGGWGDPFDAYEQIKFDRPRSGRPGRPRQLLQTKMGRRGCHVAYFQHHPRLLHVVPIAAHRAKTGGGYCSAKWFYGTAIEAVSGRIPKLGHYPDELDGDTY